MLITQQLNNTHQMDSQKKHNTFAGCFKTHTAHGKIPKLLHPISRTFYGTPEPRLSFQEFPDWEIFKF